MRTSVSSNGVEPSAAVELLKARSEIAVLAAAHRQSLRIAKELLIAQELADAQEHRTDQAIAAAIANRSDSEAIDRAVRSAALSEAAYDDERRATERWGRHLLYVYGLLATAERLGPDADGFELAQFPARAKPTARRIDRSCLRADSSGVFRR
jgi:hypothetical protein